MKRSLVIFTLSFIAIVCLLFFAPIELFDGEIHYKQGLQDFVIDKKMTLSEGLGFGLRQKDLEGVESYGLKTVGYLFVFLFTLALPALITYRLHLQYEKKKIQE